MEKNYFVDDIDNERRSETLSADDLENDEHFDEQIDFMIIDDDEALETSGSSTFFKIAFLLISFGYMLPWTSLGSLISYYKYTYSASFYVKIYCAYYLPGFPIALLQYHYDEKIDKYIGSSRTFLYRGIICFICLSVLVYCQSWFLSETSLIAAFTLLGVFSWWLHGTASMMAAIFPRIVITYLQIGFRSPEIYTSIAATSMDLGKYADEHSLRIFYTMTTCLVLLALACWILVTTSPIALSYFKDKDNRALDISTLGERTPLIKNQESLSQTQLERQNNPLQDEWTAVKPVETTKLKHQSMPRVSSNQSQYRSKINSTPSSHSKSIWSITNSLILNFLKQIFVYPSVWLGKAMQNLMNSITHDDVVFTMVCPLCLSLIITMWSSIFQASFFAYVESSSTRNIEQWLYFVRLFSDLIGRPLTFLPRPKFLQVFLILFNNIFEFDITIFFS